MEKSILVTGATGYVGSRLIPRLLELGFRVRAAGRSIDKLKTFSWATDENIELIEMDALDFASTQKAMHGISTVYYLVHSMNPQSKDFAKSDRQAANNVAAAARLSQVQRIIYLGGLGDSLLSKHLSSRTEVANIFGQGTVPVTILRAAMIIGSGSASFEILRYLVERLPIMITPKWVSTLSQPIAIRNVLNYLTGCLIKPETAGRTFDIGGPDIITYRNLMDIYAEEAGLHKRLILPVPVLTPFLSSLWIAFVTPVPAYIAMPLAAGLSCPVVCRDDSITKIIPQELLGCRQAIKLALGQLKVLPTGRKASEPCECAADGDPNWVHKTSA